ncbi:MAG: tetratricopeptide repeat protein, partial [Gemmataceae bacterium]
NADHQGCLGMMLMILGRYAEGVVALERAMELGPEEYFPRAVLARALLDRGEHPQRAKALALEAARLNPNVALVQITAGRVYAADGAWAEAEAAFRRALVLDPRNEDGLFRYAVFVSGRGRDAEAIRLYDTLLRVRPTHAAGRGNRGMLLKEAGRAAEARADLEAYVGQNPDHAVTRLALAQLLIDAKEHAAAIPHLQRARELDPSPGRGLQELITSLFAAGRADEATRLLDAHAASLPPDATLLYNVGNACLDGLRYGWAADLYRRSLALGPGYAEAHCNLGHALLRSGRFAEAAEAFRRGDELGRARGDGWRYDSAGWLAGAKRFVAVEGRLAGIADGTVVPADREEYLTALRACLMRGLHATRVRVLGRLTAAHPGADVPRSERVGVVESHVLAGLARSRDAVALSAKERAAARELALRRLTAEVAALTGGDEGKRKEAAARVGYLLRSQELAGVRDEAEVARLPGPERSGWRAAWQAARDGVR